MIIKQYYQIENKPQLIITFFLLSSLEDETDSVNFGNLDVSPPPSGAFLIKLLILFYFHSKKNNQPNFTLLFMMHKIHHINPKSQEILNFNTYIKYSEQSF